MATTSKEFDKKRMKLNIHKIEGVMMETELKIEELESEILRKKESIERNKGLMDNERDRIKAIEDSE